jgi:hypothetical protein
MGITHQSAARAAPMPRLWIPREPAMMPAMDPDSAARILDLAEPRGSRSSAVAGFALILALAAHGALVGGFPEVAEHAAMSPATARTSPMESEHMKRLMAIGAAAAMASGAAAQDAVQWRVEDGGNGHWYQARAVSPLPSSRNAQELFASGLGGKMATIDAAQENAFVLNLLSDIGSGEGFGVWIGLYSPNSNAAWQWTDGTPVTWTGWGGANCASGPYPNNTGYAAELGTMIYRQNCGVIWDDTPTAWITSPPGWWVSSTKMKLLLEWSADCNSDGIVDFGQIRAGDLEDSNANNIPDCCEQGTSCFCPGDTNDDGTVDGIDLATVLTRWGQSGSKFPDADCNNDGAIDGSDLAVVLGSWGSCPANAG